MHCRLRIKDQAEKNPNILKYAWNHSSFCAGISMLFGETQFLSTVATFMSTNNQEKQRSLQSQSPSCALLSSRHHGYNFHITKKFHCLPLHRICLVCKTMRIPNASARSPTPAGWQAKKMLLLRASGTSAQLLFTTAIPSSCRSWWPAYFTVAPCGLMESPVQSCHSRAELIYPSVSKEWHKVQLF